MDFGNNSTMLSAAAAIQMRTTLLAVPTAPLPARKFPLKLAASETRRFGFAEWELETCNPGTAPERCLSFVKFHTATGKAKS